MEAQLRLKYINAQQPIYIIRSIESCGDTVNLLMATTMVIGYPFAKGLNKTSRKSHCSLVVIVRNLMLE